MVQNSQESRRKYWATRSSVRSFAHTAHFAHSLARGKVYNLMSQFYLVLTHSALARRAGCKELQAWLPEIAAESEIDQKIDAIAQHNHRSANQEKKKVIFSVLSSPSIFPILSRDK